MKDANLPLGRETDYPHKYAPEVLCPVPRTGDRSRFAGVDIWNAWDLTWLAPGGLPRVATAEIRVPAESPAIVESKSLKLYLGSFAMSEFASVDDVAGRIAKDLSACAGASVGVRISPVTDTEALCVARLAGDCIDNLEITCTDTEVNPSLLCADDAAIVTEDLHSHVLRSLCPVTNQPDIGSVQISYRGPRIDRAGLLRYIVSFREHNDFHEACVERMYADILERCGPQTLTVHARYQRRGGIDINPVRTNTGEAARNLRIWRQ
ncbi:MAG: NADPH-dependent 7-cyano-7-deazaguanine reductase QueF [Woeseiaceae bacterium]|nr:NADPH-dependent 7-cyano-7-deazaguanine reductase QueF [Woeseiaceae bacterium]